MTPKPEHTIKQALVYLMLLVYVFGLIKPAMPLIKDVLAHTFFKSQHMATVHYENGRYHLHLELKEASKPDTTKSNTLSGAYEVLATHIPTQELAFIPFTKQLSEIHSPYIHVPTDVLLSGPFQPPQGTMD